MSQVRIWKEAPFIRLVIPLSMGILIQYHLQLNLILIAVFLFFILSAMIAYEATSLSIKFRFNFIQGLLITGMISILGSLLTYNKDVRNDPSWYGHFDPAQMHIIKIIEPIQEKANSYKVTALVEKVVLGENIIKTTGKIFLYLQKNASSADLQYGDRIMVNKTLQIIKNAGNPGEFDYKKYAGMQQVYFTVYVKDNEWKRLLSKDANVFRTFIFRCRNNILNILKRSLGDHKEESSVAEALLIGYTPDLDKQMIQAYSNTGVIHIIAISGMHLGLLYLIIFHVVHLIPIIKTSRTIRTIVIITFLWMFAFLSGANASILRSALMFSCILIGSATGRRTSIYNSLAASACILLCYDPYYLWDVGFELSYLAILGIVVFHKHISQWIYLENKLMLWLWNMASMTISAQIFTFPLCIYYFHQFPNIFLASNMIMIPLSTLILFAEIILVFIWSIPIVGPALSTMTYMLLRGMNDITNWFYKLPFSSTANIHSTLFSTVLLYIIILLITGWIYTKSHKIFYCLITTIGIFILLCSFNNYKLSQQKRLVVYNVSHHTAIDFISANAFSFLGDTSVISDPALFNYVLKPARTYLQASTEKNIDKMVFSQYPFYSFHTARILVVNSNMLLTGNHKVKVDLILITGNPQQSIAAINDHFDCNQYVMDASNPLWKIAKWKKECEQLHLQFHSIPDKGAYILNL